MVNRRVTGAMGRDRGAALVEFALVLPLLLLLVFGIIDFGRALNAQITLTQAAREGARLDAVCNATVTSTCATTVANGTVTAATGLNLSASMVSVTTCAQGAGQGVNAKVTITSYPFAFVTPIGAIAKMFGGSGLASPKLSATGVMPCET